MLRKALVSFLAFTALAHGGASPWMSVGEDDVRLVESMKLDVNLRIELIRKARRSIDIAVYDLRPDDVVTYPLLSALREAADRGVKVRILTSYVPHLAFDRSRSMARYLLEPPTLVPVEYLVVGGPELAGQGWGVFDTVHEKIFLVDGDKLLTTGRGFGENYLHWLDTDFAIRGDLTIEAQLAFMHVWGAARGLVSPLVSDPLWRFSAPAAPAPRVLPPSMALSKREAARLARLLDWFDDETPLPARVARARVLHHDFLWQLSHLRGARPDELTPGARMAVLDDPVVDAVVERLKTAKEIRLSILTTILHPRVKAALLAAAARGASITVVTNTNQPELYGFGKHRIESGGPIFTVELPDLDDLLAAGIDVRAFQTDPSTPWVYLHRKLFILDDAVIFGSHNLNLPSTAFNDEISFELESADFAVSMRSLFDADLMTNSVPIDPVDVHERRRSLGTRILNPLLTPFIGIL